MNREAYTYLLKTYGRKPGYWFGMILIVAQALLMRVVAFIFIAHVATGLAAGDFDTAKQNILFYFITTIVGLTCRFARDMLALPAENEVYRILAANFYKKLVGKDMSFFHDHQTGYLASVTRQHTDSAMDLARLLRTEAVQIAITMVIPVMVLIMPRGRWGYPC